MIRDIVISGKDTNDERYYEPPTRVLSMAVIGGTAHLDIYEHGSKDREAEPLAVIEVPAQSLLRALTAAIEDDQHEGPPVAAGDHQRPSECGQ